MNLDSTGTDNDEQNAVFADELCTILFVCRFHELIIGELPRSLFFFAVQ